MFKSDHTLVLSLETWSL